MCWIKIAVTFLEIWCPGRLWKICYVSASYKMKHLLRGSVVVWGSMVCWVEFAATSWSGSKIEFAMQFILVSSTFFSLPVSACYSLQSVFLWRLVQFCAHTLKISNFKKRVYHLTWWCFAHHNKQNKVYLLRMLKLWDLNCRSFRSGSAPDTLRSQHPLPGSGSDWPLRRHRAPFRLWLYLRCWHQHPVHRTDLLHQLGLPSHQVGLASQTDKFRNTLPTHVEIFSNLDFDGLRWKSALTSSNSRLSQNMDMKEWSLIRHIARCYSNDRTAAMTTFTSIRGLRCILLAFASGCNKRSWCEIYRHYMNTIKYLHFMLLTR